MNRRGITLIELMIAITLVSMLSAGMLFALRTGINAMDTTNDRVIANRRAIGAQRILVAMLSGVIPANADCRPDPSAPPQRATFFGGEPDSLRFVTSYSMNEAARGYPRIAELQVIPGQEGQGVRLVVNEHLYTGSAAAANFCLGLQPDPETAQPSPVFAPVRVGPASFVLADRLAYCRFSYRETLRQPPYERWFMRWARRRMPSAIRIEMAPLAPQPGKLQPTPVVIPIRINKWTEGPYADVE